MFSRAAEKGDATGMAFLAEMYERGRGTAVDYDTAKKWYRRWQAWAARQLALMYRDGSGVQRDLAAARTWLARAARAGECDAAKCSTH
jgi:TPR repeat protein